MKMTAAQKMKREIKLFDELCMKHGYLIADALPAKDRTTFVYAHTGSEWMVDAYAVKLIVPTTSGIGQRIAALRKERDPRTSKSARARAKARAKAR